MALITARSIRPLIICRAGAGEIVDAKRYKADALAHTQIIAGAPGCARAA
jgi:hypothetical protein